VAGVVAYGLKTPKNTKKKKKKEKTGKMGGGD
jgi:hypothetical protein